MDISTTYMGMKLDNPLVPSASPLSEDVDGIRQLADCGAAAVVLRSLFEEQIEHDSEQLEHYLHYGADRFSESLSYFPAVTDYRFGPEQYLAHIAQAKKAVGIPVIASLNGVSARGWTSCARKMAEAGADAIELNVYYIPTNPKLTAEDVERVYLEALKAVKACVSIPVAIKLSPYFSATANMMQRLCDAGADALVLFNRFYQPDIDTRRLEVVPHLTLSTSADSRLPLRWAAILHGKVSASIAVTSGIHTADDVVKMIMAGADVTMMCSALLANGPDHLSETLGGLRRYMQSAGYESLEQMKGILSHRNCPEPAAFERANYMKALAAFGPTSTVE